jgi:hypothetical protein
MLSMPFRDTVGQNPIDITEVNSTHGHPTVMSSVRINPVQEKWLYPPWQTETIRTFMVKDGEENEGILLANSNQWYFNSLVKKPCHKTHCRCPHRLNLSFQSSRSCALPNIKVLKDKDLEFANSIRTFIRKRRSLFFLISYGKAECCCVA